VHDGGFDFRTSSDPPREFLWSQTAWIETTSTGTVTGGENLTHPNVVTKVGSVPGQIVEGGITDQSAGNSDHLHITPSGLVGIGTGPSALAQLQVVLTNDPTPSSISAWDSRHFTVGQAGNTGGIGFSYNATNGYGIIQVVSPGAAWRNLVLQSGGGLVGIGIVPSYLLQLGSDSAGKPSTSTWTVVSDLRLKQNMEPVKDDSLAILDKLNWIRYEYNGKGNTPQGVKGIGLLAQELKERLPEAVRSAKAKLSEDDPEETDLLAIDYHHVIVHSARAIQQLSAEVQQLKAQLKQ
jgi:hypothetical protein